jgi:branched-chain amino acid transport system ATP-binding protein
MNKISTLLNVEALEQSFGGVMALAGVSFQTPENLIYAIIGPNGAGKTTLFNVLCGFYQPAAGSLRFNGQELRGLPPYRIAALGIARTFQNLQLFFNMTVLENVMVGCHLRAKTGLLSAALRLPRVRREERQLRAWAGEALELCELSERAGQPAGALPYGLMKRVEIARALAAKPRLPPARRTGRWSQRYRNDGPARPDRPYPARLALPCSWSNTTSCRWS